MSSGVLKLNNTNFEVWILLVEALMTRKGIEEVGFGRVPRPETGLSSKGVKDWERKNKEARAEILLHVEEDQLAHCFSLVASEIIEELTRVHRARGLATCLALRRRFLTMKKRADQPMSQWVAEVRNLAQRLHGIGVTVDDEDIILTLTMGLLAAYDTFVVTLDATPAQELDLYEVISRLLNKESRHVAVAAAEDKEVVTAAVARAAGPKRAKPSSTAASQNLAHITYYNCGNKGHYQANCLERRAEAAKVAEAKAAISEKMIVEIDGGW